MPVARMDAGGGATFLISAGIVYEIIAAACSSPQTTEINADTREATLMKWVHIGLVQSGVFVGIAVAIEPARRWEILGGGGLAAGIMYGSYYHARKAGMTSLEPGTEDTSKGPRGVRQLRVGA